MYYYKYSNKKVLFLFFWSFSLAGQTVYNTQIEHFLGKHLRPVKKVSFLKGSYGFVRGKNLFSILLFGLI